MIAITHLYRQKVALFGLGNSGIATASALILGGCDVVMWDDNKHAVEKAYNKGFQTVNLRSISWEKISSLILSPGVSLTHPQPHWVVRKARACKVEIIGDIELFVRERNFLLKNQGLHACPIIAITGTNGKSTTATLVSHLLTHAGCEVETGGNIGVAVLSLSPLAAHRFYVLECSSYQIELAPSLKPNIAILLNITPDHIDRHGSFSRYVAIKKRLILAAKVAIINGDDTFCAKIINDLIFVQATTVNVVPFGSKKFFSNYFGRDRFTLKQCFQRWYFFKDSALFSYEKTEKFLVSLPQGVLRGRHGIQNTLAAVACCEIFSFYFSDLANILHSFHGLPHRMEEIIRWKHVLFVNDSKATNAEATSAALSAFSHIYWIVGGVSKEGGIESLKHFFPKIKKAFLIGESADNFATVLNGRVPFVIVKTLKNAVKYAICEVFLDEKRQTQTVVLLSPACASFDQFANYEERGDMFRKIVYDQVSDRKKIFVHNERLLGDSEI